MVIIHGGSHDVTSVKTTCS